MEMSNDANHIITAGDLGMKGSEKGVVEGGEVTNSAHEGTTIDINENQLVTNENRQGQNFPSHVVY